MDCDRMPFNVFPYLGFQSTPSIYCMKHQHILIVMPIGSSKATLTVAYWILRTVILGTLRKWTCAENKSADNPAKGGCHSGPHSTM